MLQPAQLNAASKPRMTRRPGAPVLLSKVLALACIAADLGLGAGLVGLGAAVFNQMGEVITPDHIPKCLHSSFQRCLQDLAVSCRSNIALGLRVPLHSADTSADIAHGTSNVSCSSCAWGHRQCCSMQGLSLCGFSNVDVLQLKGICCR